MFCTTQMQCAIALTVRNNAYTYTYTSKITVSTRPKLHFILCTHFSVIDCPELVETRPTSPCPDGFAWART
ncbi:hypothetical protein GBA52_007171 [Prunus armeniaca]|nr:hypothetical protein GBA52_007171 [Prunus armeniaca]